jgi:hypothetical protein
MRRFIIRYRDEDPGSPIFTASRIAHDKADAEEKFHDGYWDGGGWVIVSIAAEIEGETLRQTRARHEADARRRA